MRGFCHPLTLALPSILLVVAVLAAGCGSADPTGSEPSQADEDTVAAATRTSGPTEAVLEPLGDSTASGRARYLLEPNSTPILRLDMRGLDPTPAKEGYRLWVFGNRHDMVGLATFKVGKKGRISYQSETVESHAFVEEGTKTDLLITKVDSIERLREGLLKSEDPWDPLFIGEPILRGTFEGPFVGSAGDR